VRRSFGERQVADLQKMQGNSSVTIFLSISMSHRTYVCDISYCSACWQKRVPRNKVSDSLLSEVHRAKLNQVELKSLFSNEKDISTNYCLNLSQS
jgi:hypothetical protein